MPTSDGRIGHRDLCTSAVVERTIGPASVSSLKIAASLQSDNFVSGSAGWKIERDTGSAEFQDVTVRGTLTVSDGTGSVEIDDGNWAADFASISLNRGFTNPGIVGVHGTNDQLEITAPWDTTVGDRAFIILGNDTASLPGRLLLQAGNGGELALQSGTQTTFFGGNVDFFGAWEVESSDGDITGSLIPSVDSTHHLGSTGQRWSTAWIDQLTITTSITLGWQTWTPTFANITVGNGTVVARFVQIGDLVVAQFRLTFGSTTTMGSNHTISLPVTADTSFGGEISMGLARLSEDGGADLHGYVRRTAATTCGVRVFNASTTFLGQSSVTATVPFTWGTSDILSFNISYEAA